MIPILIKPALSYHPFFFYIEAKHHTPNYCVSSSTTNIRLVWSPNGRDKQNNICSSRKWGEREKTGGGGAETKTKQQSYVNFYRGSVAVSMRVSFCKCAREKYEGKKLLGLQEDSRRKTCVERIVRIVSASWLQA